ncbi:MAG TPA: S41 family peptidase [Pyrinomonadaceae bacterium]|nr:S41 family peptidase [Pyrinomonadaceae bacterium]
MLNRDPEKNFEEFWKTFNNRYPFFEVRNVDWKKQYETFRVRVTSETGDDELFEIFCDMLAPLNDGHVSLIAQTSEGWKRRYTPEKTPRFWREFTSRRQITQLFETTGKTLVANGFDQPQPTEAWILHYGKSPAFGYLRILELEGVNRQRLSAAMDQLGGDFKDVNGTIIDIRDCPGGDDDIAITIINRFCDSRRVAFHRQTKVGPGENDLTPLKTWHIEPEGEARFTGPIVLLTCDSVFSGGEIFALAIKQLPYVTIVGEHTNGIFSYELEKTLPNGWRYSLSYQKYFSPDMVCYEGQGVPPDIELCNSKEDIEAGTDPLITRALEVLKSGMRK